MAMSVLAGDMVKKDCARNILRKQFCWNGPVQFENIDLFIENIFGRKTEITFQEFIENTFEENNSMFIEE